MAITADQTPATSTEASNTAWRGFVSGPWRDVIDVRDFIQRNYTPYDGDDTFLAPATERTTKVWTALTEMFPEERAKGVYDIDTHTPGTITSHAPGYISRDDEIIVGLQTDAPLKRAMIPNGGWRMVEGALKTYGYETDPDVAKIFTEYRKTHNQGVFDVYPPSAKAARHSHIITGLPDAYGRGRIIGDYRRVALYGIDALVAAKKVERDELMMEPPTEETLREREENAEQIRALNELKAMAASYGYDISGPATNAREAVQWLYFAYLAAVKEQNGAAMSLGRTSTFIDVFVERDLAEGTLDRVRGPGDHRRLRHQAADRAVPAHPGVRRAVLRRPDLGHRVDRRPRRRRPLAGHQVLVPVPAHAVQPGPGARAEPDGAVEPAAARGLQGVLRQGLDRHLGRSSTSPTSCCAASAATTRRSRAACRA